MTAPPPPAPPFRRRDRADEGGGWPGDRCPPAPLVLAGELCLPAGGVPDGARLVLGDVLAVAPDLTPAHRAAAVALLLPHGHGVLVRATAAWVWTGEPSLRPARADLAVPPAPPALPGPRPAAGPLAPWPSAAPGGRRGRRGRAWPGWRSRSPPPRPPSAPAACPRRWPDAASSPWSAGPGWTSTRSPSCCGRRPGRALLPRPGRRGAAPAGLAGPAYPAVTSRWTPEVTR